MRLRLILALLIAVTIAMSPFTHGGALAALTSPLSASAAGTTGHEHHAGAGHVHEHQTAQLDFDQSDNSTPKFHDCKTCQQCVACAYAGGPAALVELSARRLTVVLRPPPQIPDGIDPAPGLRPPAA